MPSVTSPVVRSISLKSCKTRRCSLLKKIKKKRPSTWTCHKHLCYTVSPRVSQHNLRRQTMATISTLTTNTHSERTTMYEYRKENIFHTQSLLFLFGFLFFPCWWIGGYYLKIDTSNDIEKKKKMTTTTIVHPSLLANGKTSSKLFWHSSSLMEEEDNTYQLFYKWNKCMSFVSIGLILIMTSLILWYYLILEQ